MTNTWFIAEVVIQLLGRCGVPRLLVHLVKSESQKRLDRKDRVCLPLWSQTGLAFLILYPFMGVALPSPGWAGYVA